MIVYRPSKQFQCPTIAHAQLKTRVIFSHTDSDMDAFAIFQPEYLEQLEHEQEVISGIVKQFQKLVSHVKEFAEELGHKLEVDYENYMVVLQKCHKNAKNYLKRLEITCFEKKTLNHIFFTPKRPQITFLRPNC